MSDVPLSWKSNIYDRIVTSTDPTELANKAIITRYVDAVNQGDFDVLDSLVVEDTVEHDPMPGQEPGLEGLKAQYRMFIGSMPDIFFRCTDVIAEGDLVFARGEVSGTHEREFFGIAPTGKKLEWTGTHLFRLRNLKVTEGWLNIDVMGLMQQMGVVPTPPGPDPSLRPSPTRITGAPSTRKQNRELMVRFIDEVWNKGNLDVADEVFHPEAYSPSAPALPLGPEGVKLIAGMFRSAFPDYGIRIELMAAEDDRVAARFRQGGTHEGELFGIPATGRRVEWTEMGILRIANDQVVESWYDVDMMGLMQQLGVGGG